MAKATKQDGKIVGPNPKINPLPPKNPIQKPIKNPNPMPTRQLKPPPRKK